MEEKPAAKAPAREKARAKLSYKEQRELEALPKEIAALEAEQKALEEKMSGAEYCKQGAEEIKALLMKKLERWEGLEGKATGALG